MISYSDELEISLYGLTQKEIIQTLLEERFSVKVHLMRSRLSTKNDL